MVVFMSSDIVMNQMDLPNSIIPLNKLHSR
jgi:hypothetical protein